MWLPAATVSWNVAQSCSPTQALRLALASPCYLVVCFYEAAYGRCTGGGTRLYCTWIDSMNFVISKPILSESLYRFIPLSCGPKRASFPRGAPCFHNTRPMSWRCYEISSKNASFVFNQGLLPSLTSRHNTNVGGFLDPDCLHNYLGVTGGWSFLVTIFTPNYGHLHFICKQLRISSSWSWKLCIRKKFCVWKWDNSGHDRNRAMHGRPVILHCKATLSDDIVARAH